MVKFIAMVAGMLLLSSPAFGQDVNKFMSAMREIDPQGDVVLQAEHVGSGLGYIYVGDVWYHVPCYQRVRLANNLQKMWRSSGGDNIVINDRVGAQVADFKVFGSGMKVKGCD